MLAANQKIKKSRQFVAIVKRDASVLLTIRSGGARI